MKTTHGTSRRNLTTLAVLLLLAATASGCGVGLPTQPSIEQAGDARGATAMRSMDREDPIEMEDPSNPGGMGTTQAIAGEVVIPTPTGGRAGNGLAKGHFKNKNKPR